MKIIFSLCLSLFWGAMGYQYAKKRGYDRLVWFSSCLIFGLLAFIILIIVHKVREKKQPQVQPPLPKAPEFVAEATVENELYWYYLDEDKKPQGPFSFRVLKSKYENCRINESTYVWNEEMTTWAKFKEYLKT